MDLQASGPLIFPSFLYLYRTLYPFVKMTLTGQNGDTHFSEDCAFSILQPHSSLFFL